MKKGLFSVAFALLVTSAFAQNQVIKVNPLGLILGSASLSYERIINTKSAFQINANYGSLSVLGVKYTSFGGGVDYKLYLSKTKEAPRGFYVSPGLAFSSTEVSVDDGGGTGSVSTAVIKAVLGHQWIWRSGFALDIFGGINYYASGDITINHVSYGKFAGALPALGISLGYGW